MGYLTDTKNFLYSVDNTDKSPFDLVPYTKKRRKTKVAVSGIAVLLTVFALVADWFSYVRFHDDILSVFPDKDGSGHHIGLAYLTLLIVASVLVLTELICATVQYQHIQKFSSPITSSELMEEVVSGLILICHNTGVPALFLTGYIMDLCPVLAHVRYFPMRLSLFAATFSITWRILQSFAYCCNVGDSKTKRSCHMTMCQSLRCFRAFVIVVAICIVVTLLTFSFSLNLHHTTFATSKDTKMKTLQFYQRLNADYEVITPHNSSFRCESFTLRSEITIDFDVSKFSSYRFSMECEEFTPYYAHLVQPQHQALVNSHQCRVIVQIQNTHKPMGYTRELFVGYELSPAGDEDNNCVSGQLNLVTDKQYDPEVNSVVNSFALWSHDVTSHLKESSCNGTQLHNILVCSGTSTQAEQEFPTFICQNADCLPDMSNSSQLALISSLLVSEAEVQTQYPCVPRLSINESPDNQLCRSSDVPQNRNVSLVIASCMHQRSEFPKLTLAEHILTKEKLLLNSYSRNS